MRPSFYQGNYIPFDASRMGDRYRAARVTNLDDGRCEADMDGYHHRILSMLNERAIPRSNQAFMVLQDDGRELRMVELNMLGDEVRAATLRAHTPTIAADMAYNCALRWP